MNEIKTLLGLIIFKWDEDLQDYIKYRIFNIIKLNDDKFVILKKIDSNEKNKRIPYDEFIEIMENKEYQILKSEGILSVSTVKLSHTQDKNINDIRLIWFKNDQNTDKPDFSKPTVIASQALQNIYSSMFGNDDSKVGISIPENSLPAGYSIQNFLIFEKILTSRMYHLYKTDTIQTISHLTNDENVRKVLIDLYKDHENYLIKTRPFFDKTVYRENLDGYCKSYIRFLIYTGFVHDIRNSIGISDVTFRINEDQKHLTDEQKQEVSILYGGIRIDKTFIYKYNNDINLSNINMKYIMIMDNIENLYIIGYTEYPEEILISDIEKAYKITEYQEKKLQAKLKRLVAIYDSSNPKNKDGKK